MNFSCSARGTHNSCVLTHEARGESAGDLRVSAQRTKRRAALRSLLRPLATMSGTPVRRLRDPRCSEMLRSLNGAQTCAELPDGMAAAKALCERVVAFAPVGAPPCAPRTMTKSRPCCSRRRRKAVPILPGNARVRGRTRRMVFLPPDGAPEIPDDDDDDSDRSIDVNELRRAAQSVKSPYLRRRVGADELNELFTPTYLEKLRHVLRPEEAFGAVFTWKSLFSNARELELSCWRELARQEELPEPTSASALRAETYTPEAAVERVFRWSSSWGRIKELVFRRLELFNELLDDFEFKLRDGASEWLHNLSKYGVKSCLLADVSRERCTAELRKNALTDVVREVVTAEDEPERFEDAILLGCERVERPPQKTVAFVDTVQDVIAAHEADCRVVALIGAYPKYELHIADATIRNFHDLGVYDVRKLFAEAEADTPDYQLELE